MGGPAAKSGGVMYTSTMRRFDNDNCGGGANADAKKRRDVERIARMVCCDLGPSSLHHNRRSRRDDEGGIRD